MLLQEVETYGNLELLAKQTVEGFITGMHKSPFHGFSVEFAEHRQYNPGENTRNIDWKLFARSEKLFVKKFEEETNLRCRILLDISSSMYYPETKNSKLRFSVLAAASICNLLKKQRDAFAITTFDNALRFQGEMRSNPSHLGQTMRVLQPYWDNVLKPENAGGTSVGTTLQYIAQTTHRRSLIVIFSDMFDNNADDTSIWQALQQLRFNKHEVILFHIRHAPEEINFDFPNRPTRFVDLESGEKLLLNPGEIREYYTAQIEIFDKEIHTRCMQYKIDFYPIDVSKDFHQVLLPFYVKRMRMV
jgi:uncharacterized protein (DUF58 family)